VITDVSALHCAVGSILLTSVAADGTVISSQQGVALSDEKEKISSAS
jgi:hypothetical protein